MGIVQVSNHVDGNGRHHITGDSPLMHMGLELSV